MNKILQEEKEKLVKLMRNYKLPYGGWNLIDGYIPLADFLTASNKRVIDKMEDELRNNPKKQAPMGVSQWRNHGKEYHYWEFFEKEVREKILAEIEKILSRCLKYCQKQNGLPYCKNCGLSEEALEDLKTKIKGL